MKRSIPQTPVEIMAYSVADQALGRQLNSWYWEFFQFSLDPECTWEDLIYEVLDRVSLRYPSGRVRKNWRKLIDQAAREVVREIRQRYPEQLIREKVAQLYHY